MKTLILIISLLASLTSIQAKDILLQGRVISSEESCIIGAAIQCFQQDSIFICGGISDDKGCFNIQLPHKGDYKLSVSYIGYKTNNSFWKNIENNINVGNITLTSTSIALDEVAITAQQVVRTANKLTIFPSPKQLTHSVGGYEVLAHLLIPTLEVDPFKKTISMKEGPVIACINGRQATNEEVKNINSNDILRVDFYDHGHPDYPETYAVIDYVLRPHEKGGTVTIDGEQHLNRATGNYDITNQFFKGKSEITLYLNNAYNNFNIEKGTVSETQFIYPENTLIRKEETLPSKQWDNTFSSYLNYSYKTSKNHFNVAVRYNMGKAKNHNNKIQSLNIPNSITNINDYSRTDNINPGIELFYKGQFKHKQVLSITLSSDYNRNKYTREYSEPTSAVSTIINNNAKEDFFSLKILANYAKTFQNNGTVSIALIHAQNDSHINQLTDESSDTKDYLKYSGSAIYITYQQIIKKLSLRLRWGNSIEIQESKNNATIRKMQLYPQINLDYRISPNQNWQFVTRYSHDTPKMAWLTNTEQQIDPLQIRRGNPNLQNRHLWATFFSYSLNGKRASLTPRIEYTSLFNYIYESISRENKFMIHSYKNGGTLRYFLPDLTLNLKIVPEILTLKLNIGWEKQWYNTWQKSTITNWIYNANILFMYKGFMASADIYAPTKTMGLGDTTRTPLTYRFNFGYTLKNFNVQFGTRNPFSSITKQIELTSPYYISHTDSYIPKTEDHVFYVKANYRFNFGKKHEFSNPNIENTSKSAILKAY